MLYQWFKDGVAIPGPHAQQSTLTIEGVATSDCGRYYATVANSGGTAKSIEAVVHVRLPPDSAGPLLPALSLPGRLTGRSRHRRGRSRTGLLPQASIAEGLPEAEGSSRSVAEVGAAAAADGSHSALRGTAAEAPSLLDSQSGRPIAPTQTGGSQADLQEAGAAAAPVEGQGTAAVEGKAGPATLEAPLEDQAGSETVLAATGEVSTQVKDQARSETAPGDG